MRILILTHPRTGGFSLLSWINKEKPGKKSYHEPLLGGYTCDDFIDTLTNPRLIVKEHLYRIIQCLPDPSAFINSFDLVIFHTRHNIESCSVSLVRQGETGDSHKIYSLNETWIPQHTDELRLAALTILGWQDDIQDQILLRNPQTFIQTTYEGIYEGGADISLISDFLGIHDPQWLSILNPKRRLRDGDPNLTPPRKKPKLI